MKNINNFDKEGKELLLKCAIHISVIGSGNRTYGMIRDKTNTVLEIKNVFLKYGVLYNKNISEKYEKNALSARRLVRLFRYHIQRFIIENKRPSYLWLKYSNRDEKMISICFAGGEHLVETKEEAAYLLETYRNLDSIMKTKFEKRLERVFIARGILPPSFFIN